ncbi:TetR/AcrR family transcriptional regulator [Actinomycetospora termitidis]|uniref:Helix-turn-helix domain-containing protein n=1 Tax=Actinomycetospora termitidis TaxID=3053470 RepID=A0ABT7MA17_9PSEU|nr:TetR/AcrR family transcriptional regulator [Actinomycetospora sp. Odt1-22]MDL5156677.1 helix-turn-helix domain-containing protein [Actinomycetospora sp. Odt1-22]
MTTGVHDGPGGRRGRPPVTEEQRRRQRLAISREAVELFRRHGVTETTGEQIARAAGVSERTLWRLFRAKEACVEPLLSVSLDAFTEVLRSWPMSAELGEHLRTAYLVSSEDMRAVLAVVRMSRDEPAIRATWLVLHERAEPVFAAVLGGRLGLPAEDPTIRVRAAAVNAALRVLTDDLAWEVASDPAVLDDLSGPMFDEHRARLAEELRTLTELPARRA